MKRVQVTLSDELYEWLKKQQIEDEKNDGIKPSLSAEIFAYVHMAYKADLALKAERERKETCVPLPSVHIGRVIGPKNIDGR